MLDTHIRHPRRGTRIRYVTLRSFLAFAIVGFAALTLGSVSLTPSFLPQTRVDPKAWGEDHVGKARPDYLHGDECLFCHRNTIGATWQRNAHGVTLRDREDAPALRAMLRQQPLLGSIVRDIDFFLGSRHRVRFLQKAGYGKLALLDSQAVVDHDGRAVKWIDVDRPSWDRDRFAGRCAGCHATAVDPETRAFSAFGIDCYACHGDVTLDHTKDTSLIWWSAKRRADRRVEQLRATISICGQCHLRGGRSRSTGLPYANTFVAGDNLFRDFEVDWAKTDDAALNPGDRHIYRTIRDIVVRGADAPTCFSCHLVHASWSGKHQLNPRSPVCLDCHEEEGTRLLPKLYTVRSALCEYDDVPSGRR